MEQFEMFVEDLRNYCMTRKEIAVVNKALKGVSEIKSENGMIWHDTGLHEVKHSIQLETTNKVK